MMFALLILVSLAIAGLRIRRRGYVDPGQIRAALTRCGLSYLAIWILGTGVFAPAGPLSAPVVPTAFAITFVWLISAGLAVVLWTALVDLVFYRLRSGGLGAGLFFGSASALVAILWGPGAAVFVAIPALWQLRWRREMSASTLTVASLTAFLFVLLHIFTSRVAGQPLLPGSVLEGLATYVRWIRYLTVMYAVLALPRLVWGMNLQIQSVRLRLTISHLLAGLVPVILVGVFWGLSTYLSVTADRAMIAARHIEEEAAELGVRIESALPSRGVSADVAAESDPYRILRDWARLEDQVQRGLRLWVLTESGWARAWGETLGDDTATQDALSTWPDTLAQEGIVLLQRRNFLGAIRRSRLADGTTYGVAALLPLEQMFAIGVARRTDATAFLDTGINVERDGRGFTVVSDTTTTARQPLPGASAGTLSMGAALVHANEFTPEGWRRRALLLHAELGLFEALRGLTRNLQENPFNAVPLVFLAIVAMLFVLVVLLTLGMVISMGRSITRALGSLRIGTTRLREGNLRYRIPIEGSDDLWEVAESFNRMAVNLEEARDQEIERKRLEGELALAHQIQARLLPGEAPVLPRTELAGLSLPAREVGGDYYDFLPLPDNQVGLIVADVSGKGVPAALLMSSFRASLLSQRLDKGPGEVLRQINSFLHRSVEPGRFVTAFLGVLDLGTGRLVYANAGHNPPYWIDREGHVRALREGGLVLGLFRESAYEQAEVTLGAGDLLALFTDGVTEAQNPEEELWGEDRMLEVLRTHFGAPCRRIVSEILGELRTFVRDEAQSDDITLLLARWRGAHSEVIASNGGVVQHESAQGRGD